LFEVERERLEESPQQKQHRTSNGSSSSGLQLLVEVKGKGILEVKSEIALQKERKDR